MFTDASFFSIDKKDLPGNVIRPWFECSIPNNGWPGWESFPSSQHGILKNTDVLAFFMAISIGRRNKSYVWCKNWPLDVAVYINLCLFTFSTTLRPLTEASLGQEK